MKLHTSPFKEDFLTSNKNVSERVRETAKKNQISNPSCSFAIFQWSEAKIATRYCPWRRFFLVLIWRIKIETSSQVSCLHCFFFFFAFRQQVPVQATRE